MLITESATLFDNTSGNFALKILTRYFHGRVRNKFKGLFLVSAKLGDFLTFGELGEFKISVK